jgi:WD40 repeat protein
MALQSSEYNYGLIATGMIDGTINIWDPSKLASDDPEPLIVAVEQHTGPIAGLQFNPHRESSHLLASGGADSEIYVMSLDRPETPNVFVPAPPPSNTRHTADITKVAWNSQVAHILASSSQNGSCIVWDLRQKKAWYVSLSACQPSLISSLTGASLKILLEVVSQISHGIQIKVSISSLPEVMTKTLCSSFGISAPQPPCL